MKKLISMSFSMALALAVAGSSLSAPRSREDEKHNRWLFKSLNEIKKIKVGSTRKEVDKAFSFPGGTQRMNPLIMVYRKSPYIFVRVNFKTKRDAQGRVKWSPNDRVASISQPFLQHWTIED